ncbi:hypothetical protein [Flavobacterium terrisoli]|uniref:hypothetical protein n=1 Tax=Flavobacterium terrisoli TaxID=3242195 RepID=UPI002542AB84|nr:hypothetical protein [Flavobacterium buctense]
MVIEKPNNTIIYQLLYATCVLIPFINIYELTFAVWFLTAVVTISNRYSLGIIKYITCFSIILLTAYISSFFNAESTYNFFRDIAYLLKPIIGLLVGYQLYKRCQGKVFTTVVYTGVFLSLAHLVIVAITFLRFRTISVNLLREFCGYHSDYEVYVLIILLFYKKFQLDWSPKRVRIFVILVATSIFLYLSRTNFIEFIVLYIAIKGYFVINKRSITVMSSVLLFVVLGYTAVYQSNPQRSGKGIEAFLYKIKNAPIEPFKTKINKEDWKDFNDNYRSYENILTVKQVTSDGTSSILFGKGLGATINLGREIWTNDGEFIQYIPILHNGFATVFLKSGVFGVLFLIIFMILLGKPQKSNLVSVQNINLLLIGSAVFLIVSNWVFMGLYLKLDNKSILLGFLICYREMLMRSEKGLSTEPKVVA